MTRLVRKKNCDPSRLQTGSLCLGYDEIVLRFNAGPFPGGGDCLIVEADGEMQTINSNDLIYDLEAYEIVE